MPSFSRAIFSKKKTNNTSSGEDDTFIGDVDREWSVGVVPNGGYVLALVLEACIQRQKSTAHPDPIHVTAHYLKATSVSSFEVRVRTLKTGKGFSNILAELVQEDEVRITTHMIFGVLSPPSNLTDAGGQASLTVSPPSPYARRHPLSVHPSAVSTINERSAWTFSPHIKWSEDSGVTARNLAHAPTRMKPGMSGGGGVEWGAWFEMVDEEEKVTTPMLGFLADVIMNVPVLFPGKAERKGLEAFWFPTMTLSLEFKFPIPSFPSTGHSSHTVGIYSHGRFINDPQGRHDTYVEIWTAPSKIGEKSSKGVDDDTWRENQVCLVVANQMSLTVPASLNSSFGKKGSKKDKEAKL